MMVKHRQVAGNIFELLYARKIPTHDLTRNMQLIILGMLIFDNEKTSAFYKAEDIKRGTGGRDNAGSTQKLADQLMDIKYRTQVGDLANVPVTLLTTEEWEKLG